MKTLKRIFTALAIAIGLTTAASAGDTPRTISINFNSGAGAVSGEYGIVPSSSWNNFEGATQSSEKAVTVSDGTTGVTAMWWSKNLWSWGNATDNALKGYLDDGPCGDGATVDGPHICIKGIPFAYYDVIIYHATDTAPDYGGSSWGFNPAALKEWTKQTECGSQAYSYDGSFMAARNDASLKFGVTQQKTAIYGKNVSYLKKGFSWKNLDIKGGKNGNSARGGIAAIQIVETTAPVEYSATISESVTWVGASWSPELPETGMTAKDTATVTATGAPTLTLDGTITVGTLKIKSDEGDMLTVKKGAGANTSFGLVDVSEATDGTTWDSTEGFTACSALLNAMRTGNYKFYFLGEGENGVTLDYGTAQNNYNFKGHYIFDGGTHTFQNCSESAGLNFGANATEDNPTFWVKNGATLNFKSRNPCGWSATANTDGIVRIGEDSKVVLGTSASGTWYWAQRFYFEPGSELEIAVEADKMALDGGVVTDKEQLYMPASEGGVATISASGAGQLRLAKDKAGAAAFVGAGSTLEVTAPLVSQNNTTTLAKTGAGTLKLSGAVSGFGAPIQVKAGTLEYATATALGASATIAVDTGATLKIAADEDLALNTTTTGSGAVVKAGEGTLTVAAGAFGDNVVSIEGGVITFTATSAQAKEGVVLCKAATDISADVIVVNESGKELSGDFTFEDNTLSFKVNCVDLYLVIDAYSPASWSQLIEGKGWINSPESTITITNNTIVTFDFDEAITAKSLKIVSASSDDQLGISYEDFANLTIGSYDFTEAEATYGGVEIECVDAPANTETRIITGATITGFENVVPLDDDIPAGTGFYKDASNIWLCKTIADVTRTSPTTEDVQAFTNFFVGVKSGDWADKANWRTAKDGLFAPYQYEKYPQSTEAQNANWYPACFDGNIIDEYDGNKDITCAAVEGWETKLDFRNGVSVTIDHLKKFANNFMWIDDGSSVSITKLGGSAFQYGYIFNVAGSLTIGTFEGNIANIPYTYNLGDSATVTYTDGIKTGTHALNGGTLVAEGNGIAVSVTITNSVAITTPALAAVTIHPDSTLTLSSSADGDLTIGNNWTNNGTLTVTDGVVVFKPGVTPGEYVEDGGTVIIGQLVTINDCGKIAVTGETADDVRLFDAGGNPVEVTKVEDGYAFYEWDVTGKNCWWDYEFNGNGNNTGTEGTALSWDNDRPFKGSEYTEDGELHIPTRPWRNVSSWPDTATFVMYGTMVKDNNRYQIVFGSSGYSNYNTIFLATGDASKDEVVLCKANGNAAGYGQGTVDKLCTMTVPNATTAKHLYAFTLKTVGGNTVMDIYLDGELLQEYPFTGTFALGPGFQIASPHGGPVSGYSRPANDDPALLDWLRVYNMELSKEVLEKYAVEYPYVSPNGSYQRTVADGDSWTATDAWTVEGTEPAEYADVPKAGSTVKLAVNGETTLGVNLDADVSYEAIQFNGDDLTVSLAEGEQTGKVVSTGRVTADANITFKYDAFTMAGAPITVKKDKTVTFDLSMVDMTQYFETKDYDLTGYATLEEGAQFDFIAPTELHGREVSAKIDETTKHYIVTVTAPNYPFTYTIASTEETGVWTWGTQEVTEETVDANTSIVIEKAGDGTLQKDLADRTYVVNEGLFTTTNAAGRTATITVNGMSTFDYNGSKDGYLTINLAGGTVLNTGDTIDTGSRQMQNLTLTEDSTVGGTGDFGLIASGYAANTLELGGKSLTKTGTNAFYLNHTTVTNGTLNVTEGSIRVTGMPVVFADDAALVLGQGTTLKVENPLTIGAITASEATIDNTSSITPFTLTGSAILTGNGTWATNNINGATVTIGEKRDFVFAGSGTVNVTLTDAEYEAGQATLFTNDEGAASVVGTVIYAGADITDQCTIKDNQITAIKKGVAKIGTKYYLTLNDAIDAAVDDDTIELLANITTDEVAAFTIAKNITIDFATFTITKTVANDWVFQIAKDADVTFTGTTGGIVHYPAVLNQVNPASMIQILGKLTVAGGAYKSDYTIFKVDEDDGATHTAKGELVVNGGTFTIEPQAGTTYTGTTYAIMNWSKATLNGGTFTGDITTLSNDGNTCSKAGETIVSGTIEGTPVYKLQVTGSTYENVPKIKGVDKADVTLIKSTSITDTLFLVQSGDYVTVAGNPEAKIGDVYYLTFTEALEAAEADQTVTLCKDITTDKAAAFTIAKNITIDFATFTITKTVANDWVFQIAKDADVTFTGTTGGIVHYPAVLNQVNPASMIQILGKLTVAGGAYKSDYTIFKVDEDDGATHTAKGELVVNGGTFTIEPQTGTTYTGTTYAIMNWSKATLNGGTFTGDITTLSNDGNACSKAGETIVGEEVEGSPVYKLQVTGSTYENVPKIKGVDIANVTLIQSSSITDELELTEKDGYVTVQKKQEEPEPVPPGEFKEEFATEEAAQQRVTKINDNIGDYITPPEGVESTPEYLALFTAKSTLNSSTGKYEVTIDLSAEGEETLQDQADTEVAAALGDGEISTIPGLYYTFVGGTDVTTITTPGTKTLAEETTTTVPKPELGTTDKAFYQLKIETK